MSFSRYANVFAGLALVLATGASSTSAGGFKLFSNDGNNVFIVTELMDAGKKVAPPTAENPARYRAISYGCDYGSLAGDALPNSRAMAMLIAKILEKQNFRGADDAHPPTLMLAFQWGYLRGSLGRNLPFLGGEKLDLMWELGGNQGLTPPWARRTLRSSIAERVMEVAQDDLYAITVTAFDFASTEGDNKPVSLWQTRIALPASRTSMARALPEMIATAGPYIGRETTQPVVMLPNANREGSVEYGELKVIESEEPVPAPRK